MKKAKEYLKKCYQYIDTCLGDEDDDVYDGSADSAYEAIKIAYIEGIRTGSGVGLMDCKKFVNNEDENNFENFRKYIKERNKRVV